MRARVTSVPPPGRHGGDGARVAAALGLSPGDVLDLSASLNPVAPDPAPVVGRHLHALGRYPDVTAATAAMADALGVDADRLVLTNGGAEAIALVAAEVGGGVRPEDEPDFSLLPRAGRSGGENGTPGFRNVTKFGGGGGGDGASRWRSNPNNPTGRLAAPGEQAGVWDEAFWPLATGSWTRGDADAVVLGSLTKLFACPGLRIGYVLAPSDGPFAGVADRVRARQPEWSVNGLAAAALPDLLASADLPGWATAVVQLRAELVEVLARHGLTARPSDANWVLVDAPGLRDRLAPHGVLVRECASFGLPGVARVAVPDELGLARLAGALEASR